MLFTWIVSRVDFLNGIFNNFFRVVRYLRLLLNRLICFIDDNLRRWAVCLVLKNDSTWSWIDAIVDEKSASGLCSVVWSARFGVLSTVIALQEAWEHGRWCGLDHIFESLLLLVNYIHLNRHRWFLFQWGL